MHTTYFANTVFRFILTVHKDFIPEQEYEVFRSKLDALLAAK